MNWVSSSLEMAGTLLESVDQQAALTLAGAEEEESPELLPLVKMRVGEKAESAAEGDATEGAELAPSPVKESSRVNTADDATSPVKSNSPPLSGSGNKLAGFVSALSSQLDNVSSGRGDRPPSAPGSSSGAQTLPTEEECARLRKELARAKAELRARDKQLGSAQKSLQVCEEELDALEAECKDKIAQVQHEMSLLQQDKDSDERNFVQALELKDAQVRSMTADIAALTEARTRHETQLAELRAELAKAVESKDSLWTSAASASNESEQLIESLRSELQDTLTALNTVKREHTEAKRTMFARQSQLENTNTELVNNVARLERELTRAKEQAAASQASSLVRARSESGGSASATGVFTSTTSFATVSEDYRKVQQTLVLTKKSLHDVIQKNEVQKQEIMTLTEEVGRLKQALGTAQESASRQLLLATQENEQLKEQLQQLSTHSNTSAAVESEARIQRLTNRVIEKQESLDALRSRVTTLEVRLQDAQHRAQTAEDKLARMERNGGIDDDMEMATAVGKPGGVGMRSRPNRMAHMISRVAPVVERSRRVRTALDVLDRWLLFLGRVFLQAPFARLGLLCYVVLVHVWMFVVLSFHTSHLTEELQLSTAAGGAAAAEPGEALMPGNH